MTRPKHSHQTHYESWACIHEPSCSYLALNDDMVCYKYSNVRGEFHYWGVNSNLSLAELSFDLDASFCDEEGVVMIKDARNVSRVIDLDHVHFTFTRDVSNGEKPHILKATARSNGHHGCGNMRLHINSKYKLELDVGLSYYPYSSYIYTTEENLVINAAVMPVYGDVSGTNEVVNCDSIGVSLSWCERDPVDLDLFLFMPDSDGKIRPSDESSIYWSWVSGMQEQRNYAITLERDDLGVDESSSRRSYGPETIDIAGYLPVGTYAIMVHAHNADAPDAEGVGMKRLRGGCATVSIYSSMLGGVAPNGKFTWTLAPENDGLSDWWHVFNLEVKETIEDTLFQAAKEDTGGPDFTRYFDFMDILTGVKEVQARDKEYGEFDVDTNGCIDQGEAITYPGGIDPPTYVLFSGEDGCISRSGFDIMKGAILKCLDKTQAEATLGKPASDSMFAAAPGGDDCMSRDDIRAVMDARAGAGEASEADVAVVGTTPHLHDLYFSMLDFDEDGCVNGGEALLLFRMDARMFSLFSGNDVCLSLDDFVMMVDGKTRCTAEPDQRCVRSVILHNVDMVVRPGLLVSDDGDITGSFPVPLDSLSDVVWLEEFATRTKKTWQEVFKPRDASMGTVQKSIGTQLVSLPATSMYMSQYEGTTIQCHATWLEVEVLSAAVMPAEALPLDSALVTLVEDESIWVGDRGRSDDNLLKDPAAVVERYSRATRSVQELKVVRAKSGVLVGGMKYFGRRSKILVTAPGFFPQIYDIRLEDG